MEELTSEQRAAIDAARASRGSCPPAETLVAYEALSAGDRARHSSHDHITICSRCQLVLLHAADPKTQTSTPIRWALPIAALLVLGVAMTMVMSRNDGASIAPPDTIRGTEIQPIAPAGSVDTLGEFTWQSPARFDRYRVTVLRNGSVVWRSETAANRVSPPKDVTPPGVELSWIVEGIDREGVVRMTSPSQSFTWIPPER